MSTDEDEALAREVASAARAEHARDRAIDAATRAGDVAALQDLLQVDAETAADIIAGARAAQAVTLRQLQARLPAAREPWHRRFLRPARLWVPAATALALAALWLRGPEPGVPEAGAPPVVVARYVDRPATAHERRQHLVRLDVSAECALDAIVHVTRWDGTGPAPDPLEPPRTLRLVWDDDQQRRGFVEVYADETRGATFIVETRCAPTRAQLLRGLREGEAPWVSLTALVVPRTRTGTGS